MLFPLLLITFAASLNTRTMKRTQMKAVAASKATMKRLKATGLMLALCVLGFCLLGCTQHDDGDDYETYQTRDYIIGIGKWTTDRVTKSDGTWTDFAFGEGRYFKLEFFDKAREQDRSDNTRKFKSWEAIGNTDMDVPDVEYEGTYTVDHSTVMMLVDGKPHMKFVVTKKDEHVLGGTVTFYKHNNLTYDVIMKSSW